MLTIILTSILIGGILAPLGCFVLWKKYAYYGDGLAHASILAAVISSIFDLNIFFISLLNAIFFAYLVNRSRNKKNNDSNISIGFISNTMLSASLILSAIYPNALDLESILFGDILLVNMQDIYILMTLAFAVIATFTLYYRSLILVVLSREIAHTRGVNVKRVEFLFLTLLSFAIIISIKIVGALLVISLLIIPAMIARLLTNNPLSMLIYSVAIIQMMNVFGLSASLFFDLPFGPSIILSGSVIYVLSKLLSTKSRAQTKA